MEKATPAAPTLSVNDLQSDLAAAADEVSEAVAETPAPVATTNTDEPKIIKQERSWRTEPVDDKPAFGGTLNATASDAEEAKRREAAENANHQLLDHDDGGATAHAADVPVFEPAVPTPSTPVEAEIPPAPSFEEPVSKPLESTSDDILSFEPTPISNGAPTLADLDSQTRGKAAEDARAAVDAALSAMPFNPAGQPLESAGASPGLELQHDSVAEQPVATPAEPLMGPAPQDDMSFAPAPPLPPLPDFSTLPPLPGDEPTQPQPTPFDNSPVPDAPVTPDLAPPVVPPPASTDPGQFQIPGQ